MELNWREIDELRTKKDWSKTLEIMALVDSETWQTRESAWDYLRIAKHFTYELRDKARVAENDDPHIMSRDAARCYARWTRYSRQRQALEKGKKRVKSNG